VGFKGVIRDITERKRIEQELNHLATHDALTGLAQSPDVQSVAGSCDSLRATL